MYIVHIDIQPDVYWEDEQCDIDQESSSNIQQTDQGYVVHCDDIPSYFFQFICGKKHERKTSIEKETNTKINIPRPGIEGDIGNMLFISLGIPTLLDGGHRQLNLIAGA